MTFLQINTVYPKLVLCPNNNLKISFLFYCHLLRQYLQFLKSKALKKVLQSSLSTHKNFITRSIAMFLKNVGVFLFCKNHNRKPPEHTKNLAEQTEKPIKTHWHKKRSKAKKIKKILQNWDDLQFLGFFSNKMIKKHITMLTWIKHLKNICPDM